MSLDFYLEYPNVDQLHKVCPECGSTLSELVEPTVVYASGITHNLNRMATAAGIYGCLWRPEENGFSEAGQLIGPLTKALDEMKAKPMYFAQYNAPNGWGLYEHFVPFVEKILEACQKHPTARPRASR